MKVLFVTPYFYPAQAFGGPVRVAYDVGKKLTEPGHEVAVFTSDAKNWRERLDVQTGEVERMKVYYLGIFRCSLSAREKMIT